MSRSAIRLAPWTIGADPSPGSSLPIRETECTTCHDRSPAAANQASPDLWALRHTGLTGHTGFRGLTTEFLRVTPAPGNPLHVEEEPC